MATSPRSPAPRDADARALVASTSGSPGRSVSRSVRMRTRSVEEDEDGDEDGDEDEDEQEDEVMQVNGHSSPTKSARITLSAPGFVSSSGGERFLQATARPAKTSTTRLSDTLHARKPYTQRSLLTRLAAHRASPKGKETARQTRELEDAYLELFPQWSAELQQGHRLLLHGLGSKIRLLSHFVRRQLRRQAASGRVIVVDGFRSDLAVADMLYALEKALLPRDTLQEIASHASKLPTSMAKLDERVGDLVVHLAEPSTGEPVYLVVNSIDGPGLRNSRAQSLVWTASLFPRVRLIASLDHARAHLLFPQSATSSQLGASTGRQETAETAACVHHHTPTLRPYTVETLAAGTLAALAPPPLFLSERQLRAAQTGGMQAASSASRAKAASFVLASLTQKAKSIFRQMAAAQLPLMGDAALSPNAGGPAPSCAMPYTTLFLAARDNFLANNVGQLEALLREFRDHEIVLASTTAPIDTDVDEHVETSAEVGQRGNEWLWIHIDKEDLEGLLDAAS